MPTRLDPRAVSLRAREIWGTPAKAGRRAPDMPCPVHPVLLSLDSAAVQLLPRIDATYLQVGGRHSTCQTASSPSTGPDARPAARRAGAGTVGCLVWAWSWHLTRERPWHPTHSRARRRRAGHAHAHRSRASSRMTSARRDLAAISPRSRRDLAAISRRVITLAAAQVGGGAVVAVTGILPGRRNGVRRDWRHAGLSGTYAEMRRRQPHRSAPVLPSRPPSSCTSWYDHHDCSRPHERAQSLSQTMFRPLTHTHTIHTGASAHVLGPY